MTLAEPQLFDDGRAATALFSPCRTYRYTLTRDWADGPRALFVMLNPSTATEVVIDPTVRRCLGFAKAWGMAGLTVVNLFALRATDPKALYDHPDPVGPDNDHHLAEQASRAGLVVAAWGTHGALDDRDRNVMALLDGVDLHCLGRTQSGHPRHPLYVRAAQPLQRFGA